MLNQSIDYLQKRLISFEASKARSYSWIQIDWRGRGFHFQAADTWGTSSSGETESQEQRNGVAATKSPQMQQQPGAMSEETNGAARRAQQGSAPTGNATENDSWPSSLEEADATGNSSSTTPGTWFSKWNYTSFILTAVP